MTEPNLEPVFRDEESPRTEFQIRYNERRALTMVICLFVLTILVLLGAVYVAVNL